MSSSAPCAPSNRMRLPARRRSSSSDHVAVHVRQHLVGDAGEFVVNRLRVDLGQAEAAAQRVVVGQQPRDLAVERRQVGEIHHADGAAADLVLVGGADAAHRRADLGAGRRAVLAQARRVRGGRKDQRRVLGDAQVVAGDDDALLAQGRDLLHQMVRVDHDAVADDRQLAGAHDARGQQRELVGDAVDDERVAGVVPALEAHDDVRLDGQPVDDLALAFVAPLGADDDHVRHGCFALL